MENRSLEFMFYGLAAAWVLVILYVFSIAARERKLRNELDRVKRLVDEREVQQKRA